MTRSTLTNFTADDFKADKSVAKKSGTQGKSHKREEKAQPDPAAVPEGTTDEVLDWVGDDAKKAELALAAEQESDKPRVTLVTPLEKLVEDEAEAAEEKPKSAADAKAAEADEKKGAKKK